MLRRRLIIEWNDDGTDTDEEACQAFLKGDWAITDLQLIEQSEAELEVNSPYRIHLKVWVEDAPCPKD